jgi:hypothetical protein
LDTAATGAERYRPDVQWLWRCWLRRAAALSVQDITIAHVSVNRVTAPCGFASGMKKIVLKTDA